jgi:hypothetical protein
MAQCIELNFNHYHNTTIATTKTNVRVGAHGVTSLLGEEQEEIVGLLISTESDYLLHEFVERSLTWHLLTTRRRRRQVQGDSFHLYLIIILGWRIRDDLWRE